MRVCAHSVLVLKGIYCELVARIGDMLHRREERERERETAGSSSVA